MAKTSRAALTRVAGNCGLPDITRHLERLTDFSWMAGISGRRANTDPLTYPSIGKTEVSFIRFFGPFVRRRSGRCLTRPGSQSFGQDFDGSEANRPQYRYGDQRTGGNVRFRLPGGLPCKHDGVRQPYFAGIMVKDSELAAVTMGGGLRLPLSWRRALSAYG